MLVAGAGLAATVFNPGCVCILPGYYCPPGGCHEPPPVPDEDLSVPDLSVPECWNGHQWTYDCPDLAVPDLRDATPGDLDDDAGHD